MKHLCTCKAHDVSASDIVHRAGAWVFVHALHVPCYSFERKDQ